MIIIETESTIKKYVIKVSGHAGYDEVGKDIVCAGVSALVQTLCYSLDNLSMSKVNTLVSKGNGQIEVYKPTKNAMLLIKSFLIGVKEIEKAYPSYVKVN